MRARQKLSDQLLAARGVDVPAYRRAEEAFERTLERARDARSKEVWDASLHRRQHAAVRDVQRRAHIARMTAPIRDLGTPSHAQSEAPLSLFPPCPIIGHSEQCSAHAWWQSGHLYPVDEAGTYPRINPGDPCHIEMRYGVGRAHSTASAHSSNRVEYHNTPIGASGGLWCVRARISFTVHLFPIFHIPSDVLVRSNINLTIIDGNNNAVITGGPKLVLNQLASWPNQPPPTTHSPIMFGAANEVATIVSLDPSNGPFRVTVFSGVDFLGLDAGQYVYTSVDTHFEGIEWGVAGAILPTP
jgi:hypothetical protein